MPHTTLRLAAPLALAPFALALLAAGCAQKQTSQAAPPAPAAAPTPAAPAAPAPDAALSDADPSAPPPPLAAGTPAPDFATRTVGGRPLSMRSLRGRVVLVDFWATWCGPCRLATPTLVSLNKKYGPTGLTVVGMSIDDADSAPKIKPFLQTHGITYPVTTTPDANGQAAQLFHVEGIPSQYLIDKKGVVRWSQGYYEPGEGAKLARLIERLQAEPA